MYPPEIMIGTLYKINSLENLMTNDSYSFNVGKLMVQGGYGTPRNQNISFPKSFPTRCIAVIAMPSGSGITESGNDSFVLDDSLSEEEKKRKFKILVKNSTAQVRLSYIAFGY